MSEKGTVYAGGVSVIEYIRRDNAIDAIENADPEVIEEWEDETLFGYTLGQIRYALDRVPAETDVVRVVRCRDCIKAKSWKNSVGIEGLKCELLCVDIAPEAFCSYGRRNDD